VIAFGLTDLPVVNASLNTVAAVLITAGFVAIKRGNKELHKKLMLSATAVSALFLVSYLTYHFGVGREKPYAGEGLGRTLYYAMLISHILLAFAVVPLVLLSIRAGLRDQIARHRRLARWTLPIWWYVSVTGVLIYLVLYQL